MLLGPDALLPVGRAPQTFCTLLKLSSTCLRARRFCWLRALMTRVFWKGLTRSSTLVSGSRVAGGADLDRAEPLAVDRQQQH